MSAEETRQYVRESWEVRRKLTSAPPILTMDDIHPIDVDNPESRWSDVSRYFSASFRSWWPRPEGSDAPGFVPFDLQTLAVKPVRYRSPEANRKRVRDAWEARRMMTDQPPRLSLGGMVREPEDAEHLGNCHFSADWRSRFPTEDGWTPYSIRAFRVLP